MAEKIYTKNAPDAIGPYSQAVVCNGMIFTSGQIAINPATGNVEADNIEGQTEQVMKNLGAVLEEERRDGFFDSASRIMSRSAFSPTS